MRPEATQSKESLLRLGRESGPGAETRMVGVRGGTISRQRAERVGRVVLASTHVTTGECSEALLEVFRFGWPTGVSDFREVTIPADNARDIYSTRMELELSRRREGSAPVVLGFDRLIPRLERLEGGSLQLLYLEDAFGRWVQLFLDEEEQALLGALTGWRT